MSCSRTTTQVTLVRLEPAALRSRVKNGSSLINLAHLSIFSTEGEVLMYRLFTEIKKLVKASP